MSKAITFDQLNTSLEKVKSYVDDKIVTLTQAEYNALTEEEKNNGTVYFITDGQGGGGTGNEYFAGTGIDITSNVISINSTVAKKTDIPTKLSEFTNDLLYQTEGQVDAKISAAVSSVFVYRGVKPDLASLPQSAPIGDTYYVTSESGLFAWNGNTWEPLSGTFDLEGLIPDPELKSAGQVLTFDGTDWVAEDAASPLTAGTGIDITNDVISVDNTIARKSEVPDTSDFVDNTTLNTALDSKQDTLTAGEGIDITNNVVSITDPVATAVELTTAEYSALSDAEKDSETIYFITDADNSPANMGDGGSGVASYNYSTEEQLVGTWIDGKPLYQVTVNCGPVVNKSANTYQSLRSVAHNINDIDTIVSARGFLFGTQPVSNTPLPWTTYTASNNSLTYQCTYLVRQVNQTNVVLAIFSPNYATQIVGNAAWGNIYVTFQYTKTTD